MKLLVAIVLTKLYNVSTNTTREKDYGLCKTNKRNNEKDWRIRYK